MKKDKIKTAHWLLGQWELSLMAERLLKHGKKANDSTYNGQVYFMKGTDTIHTEKILLQQVEDELSYNTAIKGQNDDEPVSFILTDRNETQLVLKIESITIQKISYTQISKTVW
jgi:hypothetical protein